MSMAADICPTILASDPHEFRAQTERVAGFARRLHIDLTDGEFAPSSTISLDRVWWPGGVAADLHVMYQQPFEHLEALIGLGPQLVIVHAEAEGDFIHFANAMHRHGIEAGVALLPETPVEKIQPSLALTDHVLIFSGNLGAVYLTLHDKVKALKSLKPSLEIGWDGGVNDQNAQALTRGGVDVLNVGGFIQQAEDPAAAYARLEAVVTDDGRANV